MNTQEPDINTQPLAWAQYTLDKLDWKWAIGTREDGTTFEFEVLNQSKYGWFAKSPDMPMRECSRVVLRDDPSVVILDRRQPCLSIV